MKKQRKQWEMERERERQAAFEAAAAAAASSSSQHIHQGDNRLDDAITTFSYTVAHLFTLWFTHEFFLFFNWTKQLQLLQNLKLKVDIWHLIFKIVNE